MVSLKHFGLEPWGMVPDSLQDFPLIAVFFYKKVLPRLIFNWGTFLRRVTARWARWSRPVRTREIAGVRL